MNSTKDNVSLDELSKMSLTKPDKDCDNCAYPKDCLRGACFYISKELKTS